MPTALYHLNPQTERIGVCRADPKAFGHRGCPFGSSSPHFPTKEEARSYYENELEAEYGLFDSGQSSNPLPLDRDSVARRLNLLPEETLQGLVRDRFRHGGYTIRETEAAMAKDEPFYVSYNTNQEITLELDDDSTQRTFTKGACSVFALELHRATGWPLVIYTEESDGGWGGHVGVRTPSGGLLDATGVGTSITSTFGPRARDWSVSEVSSPDELFERISKNPSNEKATWNGLPLLERFAAAKLAYDVLDREGLLEDPSK